MQLIQCSASRCDLPLSRDCINATSQTATEKQLILIIMSFCESFAIQNNELHITYLENIKELESTNQSFIPAEGMNRLHMYLQSLIFSPVLFQEQRINSREMDTLICFGKSNKECFML